MEITIIHGQAHQGSTYHITHELLNHIKKEEDIIHEFMLPKDGPSYCVGCFNCIYKGEQLCPHQASVQKIVGAMITSDLIVINSPTYCLDMSGQLKALFDHLGFMYMTHRPKKEMFHKIGITLSTAAGAGAKYVTKSIKKQMTWWGVAKTYRLSFNVQAKSFSEVPDKIKKKISKNTQKLATKIMKHKNHVKPNLKSVLLFKLMRMMHRGNTWNAIDKNHWEANGWLTQIKPWRT